MLAFEYSSYVAAPIDDAGALAAAKLDEGRTGALAPHALQGGDRESENVGGFATVQQLVGRDGNGGHGGTLPC